jgi:hypothetical protein
MDIFADHDEALETGDLEAHAGPEKRGASLLLLSARASRSGTEANHPKG